MPNLSIPLCTTALLALIFTSVTFLKKDRHLRVKVRDLVSGNPDSYPDSRRNVLLKELSDRRRELLPYFSASEKDAFMGLPGGDVHRRAFSKKLTGARSEEIGIHLEASNTNHNKIGCKELGYIKNVAFVGSGYTKAVFQGVLPEGLPVALKSVNEQGTDMKRCLEDFNDMKGCYELVSYKLMKEIVLLQRLDHPNIIKLHGHCQSGERGGSISAALEQGSPLQMIQLLQSPWEDRFRVCLGLVRLLSYLSHSPLGSVALLDFQPRQFVLVNGDLKLTDLDDAAVGDPTCQTDSDCDLQFPLRNFSLPCSSDGVCQGLNERRNLYNAYRYFFTYLLPHQAPPTLRPLIERIMNSTAELNGDVNGTLAALQNILHLYKSGLYLENLPSALVEDYVASRGMRSAGGESYRCWPSYQHQGCVLSVHSVGEAALLCSARRECAGFTINGQRTWTGRLLASFKSGFGDLVPDVNSAVYMRRAAASGFPL
ncbi:extracellular tyrosine-protein kinase PKDCC [Brienomyrus brachyistius]|uniref:extracellular tyrosine-protein kinase PKDCC n=1 Tax=Brienomyrus brachyistius TaxID=42636 RepID=UPI0020B2F8D6|nr:extracellular tyrosine-protein kinase PKDCC [Brienomyrus brachyistius]